MKNKVKQIFAIVVIAGVSVAACKFSSDNTDGGKEPVDSAKVVIAPDTTGVGQVDSSATDLTP